MKKYTLSLLFILLAIPYILFTQTVQPVEGKKGMVASAHPLATQAGIEMLEKGGNAIDAAVAAAFAIGVVEPDGSGIGGGGGMVVYLKELDTIFYINYYAKSPGIIDSSYSSRKVRHTGKSICVPGTVAGLTLAHEKFGSLPFKEVIEPAIRYARDGFLIDGTLFSLILDHAEILTQDSSTAAIFLEEGFPRMEGDLLVQQDLAKTLSIIRDKGRDGFYSGEIAESLVKGIQARGGTMNLNDLNTYQAIVSSPVHGTYRGFDIYSACPPQSGISLIEGLNILENADLRAMGHYTENAKTLHLIAETFRKVYTDRFYFIADPQSYQVPTEGLLAKEFGKERFDRINPDRPEPLKYRETERGDPMKYNSQLQPVKEAGSGETENPVGKDVEFDGSTTHLCAADRFGNVVSLTQTLGTFFGAAQTIEGVLFNCTMSNFSGAGNPNALKANVQPRSSIAPSLILKDHKPYLAIGTPGGTRIIGTLLQVIVNVLDFDMNVEEANQAPRFFTQKFEDYLHLESGVGEKVIDELEQMGHNIRVYEGSDLYFGGIQMIRIDNEKGLIYGSADKRRGGNVRGI